MQNAAEPKNEGLPRIGEKAPAFKAVTTQGEIDFPKQYERSWVILFSHPADFTPVCTSEFMTFATLEPKFAELGCKLVGLSVDGLYSHIAWLRTIKEKIVYKGMKDVEVTFPLIEDITMRMQFGERKMALVPTMLVARDLLFRRQERRRGSASRRSHGGTGRRYPQVKHG
jgi:peroxiredoxin